jgi:methylmalonyl-CoA/ethylmalonyl-CoA epimerase
MIVHSMVDAYTRGRGQQEDTGMTERPFTRNLLLPQLKMHHFSIAVRDIEASIRWYEAVFGLTLERQGTLSSPEITGRNAFLARDGIRLELWSLDRAAPVPPERRAPNTDLLTGGTKHIAFEVTGLQAVIDQLVRGSVTIATVQRRRGEPHLVEEHPETEPGIAKRPAFAAFISDPDGTLIELLDPGQAHD